jgi:hypothetical protein
VNLQKRFGNISKYYLTDAMGFIKIAYAMANHIEDLNSMVKVNKDQNKSCMVQNIL